MNGNDTRSFGKLVVIGVAALILGLVIGVAAERYGNKVSKAKPLTVAAKTTQSATPSVSSSGTITTPSPLTTEWDPFQEMRDMQAEMDQMFQRSIARFHGNPQMSLFEDTPGYSLSLDVRDLKDRYEVHALLPDAKASDAKVNLEGNRLSVSVANKRTETSHAGNGQATTTEMGQYEQVIQLADNVKSDQMRVENKDHELIITIPKA